ncbi:MAG: hypothetical protein KC613_12475, partial [Myxococcales bacterium]|nr:hypothetical protein [Myxococcales bacterium]
MLRAPTPLMLLVLAAGCDAREPTLDPAEPLAPPGCVMAEPAEVRFEAVGEARTVTLSGCGAGPGTVVGLGLGG